MTFLGRQQRLVEQKASAVARDEAAFRAAVARTADRFKKDLSSPPALLALFLAGIAYGLLRRDGDGPGRRRGRRLGHADDDHGHSTGAKLTALATALLSAGRLIDLLRKLDLGAAGFGSRGSAAARLGAAPRQAESGGETLRGDLG